MLAKNRLEIIDTIRGLTMISMILYHFCWDLKYINGMDMPWYGTFGSYLWQQSICWTFITISGFCMHFARKPVRNGIIVFLCGIIITCVTEIFLPEAPVYFGVLTMLGSCMILIGLAMKMIPAKIDPFWGLFVSIILFAMTKSINSGFINLFIKKLYLPQILFGQGGTDGLQNSFLTYLGFMQKGFYSSDYFSLMPWIFLFLAGYFLHDVLKSRFDSKIFHADIKPLSFLGRYSLLVYMLHQPVLYAVTMIIR
ncbi:heparan-alpha-glucosaminide N-acetyltransferase [Butyrivibrio sp. AE3004]|uniref:heparan-alpha-glucosaminide N-acetyltransferase n=1 Tax=Butyrivibrio sp. AE3004 TaxID=1506994 RepID=UPI00068DA75F|nr:heparan-alpha-glucosaminide N-acetyltransferase [Butyrivibrio sp. AE3004]